jgi:predicted ribosomally synthesized peptide with nif11-like leader
MSLQQALEFIARVRADEALAARLRALGPGPSLEAVAALGVAAGLEFTGEELREAHARDHALRGVRYGPAAADE